MCYVWQKRLIHFIAFLFSWSCFPFTRICGDTTNGGTAKLNLLRLWSQADILLNKIFRWWSYPFNLYTDDFFNAKIYGYFPSTNLQTTLQLDTVSRIQWRDVIPSLIRKLKVRFSDNMVQLLKVHFRFLTIVAEK